MNISYILIIVRALEQHWKMSYCSLPIEDFQSTDQYDMIVMNNVLEHCMNIRAIFDNIHKMLKPGGVFVFGDVFFNPKDVALCCKKIYDAGHPLKLTEPVMSSYLDKYNCLYEKIVHKKFGQEWRHDIFFIGAKK